MSLLNPKPTVTITPLSGQYTLRTYETVFREGILEVVEHTQLTIPWNDYLHAKRNNEFVFIKLDIYNQTDKNIEIDACMAEVLNPPSKEVEIYPVVITPFYGGKFHFLEDILPFPITKETIFEMPMNLSPHSNYYRYLCLRIVDFPDFVDDVIIKIDMIEGKTTRDRIYKTILRFDKKGDEIILKTDKGFWKKLRFDGEGRIRGLL